MSKKSMKAIVSEVFELADSDPQFLESLSGNQKTLLGQLKAGTKNINSLSDRDQGCLNALIRNFESYGQADPEPEAEEEASAPEPEAEEEAPIEALEKIDQAIEAEIVEMDILDVIDPDQDLSNFKKLSAKDESDLARIEDEIRRELPKWETANDRLGALFSEIKKRTLFRNTHRSFVKYIFDTFGVTRAKAYQLMITAEVKLALTAGDDQPDILPSQRAAQTLNSITQGVKGLLADGKNDSSVIERYDHDLHKYIWSIAIQSAPKDKNKNPIITPDHLESVKKVLMDIAISGAVDTVDGEQIPVAGLSVFADHAITEETHERNLRMKQGIIEKVQKDSARRNEPQERKVDKSREGEKLTNTVSVSCSEHGETGIKKFAFGGFLLDCGCAFVKTTENEIVQTLMIS